MNQPGEIPPKQDPPAGSLPPKLPPTPSTGIKQDVFALGDGPVVIHWPATLSQAGYDDVASWLDILRRKMKRTIETGIPKQN